MVLSSNDNHTLRASARAAVPQVNLKDRIAALQQRNAPSTVSDAKNPQPLNPARLPGGSLRDKIATFEKKGAVPVPRGSFAQGAPPPEDKEASKRKGELYGNRVPGLSHPAVPPPVSVLPGKTELAVKKRRLSTSDAVSAPADADDTQSSAEAQSGEGSSRPNLPAGVQPVERRSVSDVLPKTTTFSSPPDPLPVTEEEQVVSAVADETTLQLDTATQDSQPNPLVASAPSPQPAELEVKTPEKQVTGVQEPATNISPAVASQAVDQQQSDVNIQVAASPAAHPDNAEVIAEPTVDVDHRLSIDDDAALKNGKSSLPYLADEADTSMFSPVDDSFASDVHEAVIIPTRLVTPVSTRGKIIPAPSPTSSTGSPMTSTNIPVSVIDNTNAPAISPIDAPMKFRAIVHRKVRDVEPEVRAPVSRVPATPVVRRARAEPFVEPMSPGAGDLVALLANAALLEEQLSGNNTPVQKAAAPKPQEDTTPTPLPSLVLVAPEESAQETVEAPNVEVSSVKMPEIEEPKEEIKEEIAQPVQQRPEARSTLTPARHSTERAVSMYERPTYERLSPMHTMQDLPEDGLLSFPELDDSFSSPDLRLSGSLFEMPPSAPSEARTRTMTMRTMDDTPPPTPPPKSPGVATRFSSLRMRKSNASGSVRNSGVPGTYPRSSMCSEMSSEDSIMVATPPSPPQSDAASVRSRRSWKGIGRAASFADKLWHRGKGSHAAYPGTFSSVS